MVHPDFFIGSSAEVARLHRSGDVVGPPPTGLSRGCWIGGRRYGAGRGCPTGTSRPAAREADPAVLVYRSSAPPRSNGRVAPASALGEEYALLIGQFVDRRYNDKTAPVTGAV